MRRSLFELMAHPEPADVALLSSALEDILRVLRAAAEAASHEVPERPETFHDGMLTVLLLAESVAERVADDVTTFVMEARRGFREEESA